MSASGEARSGPAPRLLLVLALLDLALRLSLIDWFTTEPTDSYRMIDLALRGRDHRLPLYPLCIHGLAFTGLEAITAGKLISIFCGTLTLLPLWALARRIGGPASLVPVGLLYTLSPLALSWSVRSMTEAMCVLTMVAAAWGLLFYESERTPRRLALFTLLAGLACLTRPEALLFAPLTALAWLRLPRAQWSLKGAGVVLLGTLPWLALLGFFLFMREGASYAAVYEDNLHEKALRRIWPHLRNYLKVLPHVLTPMVLGLAIFSLRRREPSETPRWLWPGLLVYLTLGLLAALAVHRFWSTRHLLPCLPFWLLPAAATLGRMPPLRRWVLLAAALLWSGAVAWLGMEGTRDMQGDLKRAALFVRDNVPEKTRVFTTRSYRFGKWSERKPWRYGRKRLRSGDVVSYSSFYTRIDEETAALGLRHEPKLIYETEATIRPVLGDIVYVGRLVLGWAKSMYWPPEKGALWQTASTRSQVVELGASRDWPYETDASKVLDGRRWAWKLKAPRVGQALTVAVRHAAAQQWGALQLEWRSTGERGRPGEILAHSEWLEAETPGARGEWRTTLPPGATFLALRWKDDTRVYSARGKMKSEFFEARTWQSRGDAGAWRVVSPQLVNVSVEAP